MIKDNYEISLWEDYLVPATASISAHYEERKVAIIGSDSITSNCRAIEPKLVENINGTRTFTFKMLYTYRDDSFFDIRELFLCEDDLNPGQYLRFADSSGAEFSWDSVEFRNDTFQNPFLNLLTNERKVKLKWKDSWYEFVIKNCQEDSDGKSVTYTCNDAYINELSKTGFDILLSTDLQNNQGTVTELAEMVLQGTDWKVDTENSDIIQQEREEPVYEITLPDEFSIRVHNDTKNIYQVFRPGKQVLVYYSQIQSIIDNENFNGICDVQFAYAEQYEQEYSTQLVTNADCYSLETSYSKVYGTGRDETITLTLSCAEGIWAVIEYPLEVSTRYRATRLVKSQKNIYDPLTQKYCDIYEAREDGAGTFAGKFYQNDVIYGYKEIQYRDPTFVNNLVVNSKGFTTTEGWIGNGLMFMLYPTYSSGSLVDYNGKSYLKIGASQTIYNSGLRQLSNFIPNGFSTGEKYYFRYKAMSSDGSAPSGNYVTGGMTPSIRQYKYVDGALVLDPDSPSYFTVSRAQYGSDNWVEYELECNISVTRSEIYERKVGIFLTVNSSDLWLEEAEFFVECFGERNGIETRITPGSMDITSVASMVYTYYNHTRAIHMFDTSKLNNIWESTEDIPDKEEKFRPVYNDNYEKIRSIEASKSNRFNLLQKLAETFECWLEFVVEHNSDGTLVYNDIPEAGTSKADGAPHKYVRIKSELGNDIGIGFIYGIDLKTVRRTIKSDQIVTKTIVSGNTNQNAKDGYCTIERSIQNYPRTSFILDFDYYMTQGYLDSEELTNDLYNKDDGYMGYFYWLNKWNIQYDSLTLDISAKRKELIQQNSYLTIYDAAISSIQEQIQNYKNELMRMAEVTTWEDAQQYIQDNSDTEPVLTRMIAISTLTQNLESYSNSLAQLETSIEYLMNYIESREGTQTSLRNQVKALHSRFYRKYSRFIQEGTWNSSDYINDDLYYFDAEKNARLSSRPQVSYDISVQRLSSLEEYKNKVFKLGDISFIQDTEFFGYVYKNNMKTPYKEKVQISEITSFLDEPDKDSIKVQNYKGQFEDLFQRITSTMQSFQYMSTSNPRY